MVRINSSRAWILSLGLAAYCQGKHQLRILTSTTSEHGHIPHRLMFTHEENLLRQVNGVDAMIPSGVSNESNDLRRNVMNTIEAYRAAWSEPEAEVLFLDDYSCLYRIKEAAPDLVPHYEEERRPLYKADICRLAALYLHGGYFFDTTVQVVEKFRPDLRTTFVGTMACSTTCLRTEFLASAPKHPLLAESLKQLAAVYESGDFDSVIGPLSKVRPAAKLIMNAYKTLPQDTKSTVQMLERFDLEYEPHPVEVPEIYPDLPRQYGHGVSCNVVLKDRKTQTPYFYESMVGSQGCQHGMIPRQMWFSIDEESLKMKQDTYDNVINTIKQYRTLWNDPEAPVHFLSDDACREIIPRAMPQLLKYYNNETQAVPKAVLCRNAAIYAYGGYFFGQDAKVLKPLRPQDETTIYFSYGCNFGCMSQAFFAAVPRHPVFIGSMRLALDYYSHGRNTFMLGPNTMIAAYNKLPHREKAHKVEYLEETFLDEEGQFLPQVERQAGDSKSCRLIMYDPDYDNVFFFHRFCKPKEVKKVDH